MSFNMDGSSEPRRSRQLELLRLIRERGALEVSEAAQFTGASKETIRRDFRALEAQMLIHRSHGVAHAMETGVYETALPFRSTNNTDEKARIADRAGELLGDARTVFLDEGFQTQLVAARLPAGRDLTVVTSSLPIAQLLARRDDVQVIILGGRVRGNTLGVVDRWAAEMLHTLNLDVAFIGANGVSVDHGLSTQDPAVAMVKTAAIRSSRRRVFVGAHHKFNARTFVRFAELTDFDAMITGTELTPSAAAAMAAAGGRVIRV